MIDATRPTDLALLEPGQVIRPGFDWPDGGASQPVRLPDLTVVEKRQTAEGWVVYRQPVVKERRRRVTASYAPGFTADVVADQEELDQIRAAIVDTINRPHTTPAKTPPDLANVVSFEPGRLTVEVAGWIVTL